MHRALLRRRRQRPELDHVRDGQPAARLEDPEGLADHRALVLGKVDDAVGHDDVDRMVRKGDLLDGASQKCCVLNARSHLVPVGKLQHLVGHVDAVYVPVRCHAACCEQDVQAPAAAQV